MTGRRSNKDALAECQQVPTTLSDDSITEAGMWRVFGEN